MRRPYRHVHWDATPPCLFDQAANLHDVLITSKLMSRRRRPNAEAENAALRTLARVMAEKPNELLDVLLKVALDLCEAGTAGLSVLDVRGTGLSVDEPFRSPSSTRRRHHAARLQPVWRNHGTKVASNSSCIPDVAFSTSRRSNQQSPKHSSYRFGSTRECPPRFGSFRTIRACIST